MKRKRCYGESKQRAEVSANRKELSGPSGSAGSAFHIDGEVPGLELDILACKLLEHECVLVYSSPRSLKIDMCSLLGEREGSGRFQFCEEERKNASECHGLVPREMPSTHVM